MPERKRRKRPKGHVGDEPKFEHHPLHVVEPGVSDEFPDGAWIQFTTVRTGWGGDHDVLRARAPSLNNPAENPGLLAQLQHANEIDLRRCWETRTAYNYRTGEYETADA